MNIDPGVVDVNQTAGLNYYSLPQKPGKWCIPSATKISIDYYQIKTSDKFRFAGDSLKPVTAYCFSSLPAPSQTTCTVDTDCTKLSATNSFSGL